MKHFIEAELAKNKIKELKEQNDRRKKEELKTRHLNEVNFILNFKFNFVEIRNGRNSFRRI